MSNSFNIQKQLIKQNNRFDDDDSDDDEWWCQAPKQQQQPQQDAQPMSNGHDNGLQSGVIGAPPPTWAGLK